MSTYLAQFGLHGPRISVAILDRDDHRVPVREGEGLSVQDAIIDALHPARVTFQSEGDELDACIAAMREKSLHMAIRDDGAIVSLGYR